MSTGDGPNGYSEEGAFIGVWKEAIYEKCILTTSCPLIAVAKLLVIKSLFITRSTSFHAFT